MADFRMPSLGADMTEGVLLEWLVHPGDTVRKGDIVAVVDTAKAAVEVECFEGGVVDRLLVTEGTHVPVGTPLATIRTDLTTPTGIAKKPGPGEAAGEQELAATPSPDKARTAEAAGTRAGLTEREAGPRAPQQATVSHLVTSPLVRHMAQRYHIDTDTVPGTGTGGRITRADIEHTAALKDVQVAPVERIHGTAPRLRISPLARRLAGDLAVDPTTLVGTGPAGAINASDVRRAASHPEPSAEPMDRNAAMRATIAAAMTRSKRDVPHYYLTHTIDLSAALAWLHDRNLELPVSGRLVPAVLLIKAAARAAVAVPALNGFWVDGSYHASADVHLAARSRCEAVASLHRHCTTPPRPTSPP